jgi:hypothetical protein
VQFRIQLDELRAKAVARLNRQKIRDGDASCAGPSLRGLRGVAKQDEAIRRRQIGGIIDQGRAWIASLARNDEERGTGTTSPQIM